MYKRQEYGPSEITHFIQTSIEQIIQKQNSESSVLGKRTDRSDDSQIEDNNQATKKQKI